MLCCRSGWYRDFACLSEKRHCLSASRSCAHSSHTRIFVLKPSAYRCPLLSRRILASSSSAPNCSSLFRLVIKRKSEDSAFKEHRAFFRPNSSRRNVYATSCTKDGIESVGRRFQPYPGPSICSYIRVIWNEDSWWKSYHLIQEQLESVFQLPMRRG